MRENRIEPTEALAGEDGDLEAVGREEAARASAGFCCFRPWRAP